MTLPDHTMHFRDATAISELTGQPVSTWSEAQHQISNR
jgi:hypothetical protein